ncbi:Ig-like domain repeat protein [Salinispora tropica]|uniref:LPXTG-motif cell wall anchor domain n=1 Tax=Salinispora tropica (strain ATCC BAA-916 / DSM 44818 / JCM 13857 / NBRC 105044 / CNB-440) TaxID=369723 RepID=A4X449_SALTO|nr:cell wall anchor domain-containing protein [Salinispora tropica]ABP53649.1 LPXTG-motif cell wall anchor domain [Salinispora tropica CNB-440]
MQGICQRRGRGGGARPVRRVVAGWFSLALALSPAIGGSPASARHQPASAAVMSDAILAWGGNDGGQLGDGTTTDSSEPIAVRLPTGTTVAAVAAGDRHSVALTSAGTVLAWGRNTEGQLGNGTTTSSGEPVAVSLPSGIRIVAVAVGADHSLALTSTGSLLAWGSNDTGQLGDGSVTSSSTPVAVRLPPNTTVAAIAAGRDHNLVLTATGPAALLAWGANREGQLGDGTVVDRSRPVPVNLPTGLTVTAIAGGRDHSLALTSDDTVLAWGGNSHGQLGDGTTTGSLLPVTVVLPVGAEATAIAAGRLHSLALTSDGTALAWGGNHWGQLGNGSTSDSSEPVAVSLPGGTRLISIASRDSDHNVAITTEGAALAWGLNSQGHLGDGTTTDSATPVAVSLPAGAALTSIAVGDDHSLALPAQQPGSTTSLQVSPQNPTADQEVTLTAAVFCTTGAPTGSVTFRSNNTDLATVPLGSTNTATHTTMLPVGTNTLTADFTSIDTTCPNSQSEATTITVAEPPELPTTGPNLPTLLGAAALFLLTGTALIHLSRQRRPTCHPH